MPSRQRASWPHGYPGRGARADFGRAHCDRARARPSRGYSAVGKCARNSRIVAAISSAWVSRARCSLKIAPGAERGAGAPWQSAETAPSRRLIGRGSKPIAEVVIERPPSCEAARVPRWQAARERPAGRQSSLPATLDNIMFGRSLLARQSAQSRR
jgi:hypothetical protein